MPDITLNLPVSSSPLASGSPVGEIRGIGADASAEDAATAFAALLQNTLQGLPEDAKSALLAGLSAEDTGSTDADEAIDTVLIDSAAATPDLLASGLALATVSRPDAQPVRTDASASGLDADGESLSLTPDAGRRDTAGTGASGLPAAGIAVPTEMSADTDGKTLPDAQSFAASPAESGFQAAQQAQGSEFRAHLGAAQRQTTELAVATPINHSGWAEDVGHQITWLAEHGSSKAELVLTPPHLGRIEISLQIGSDLSTAQFVSASPQVREALEQAMPRLREMLAGGGISLGEANVSSDHPSGERNTGGERNGRGREGAAGTEGVVALSARRGAGLVDLFA